MNTQSISYMPTDWWAWTGVPTRDQCRIWLLNAAEKFFLCGDAPVEHLSRALMMVGEPK